jgi:hypothetical protein
MAAQEQTGDAVLDNIEECFERGWTDGLPVVPPTHAGLERMVRGGGRDPQEILGTLPPKGGLLTVEKVALNALMAGCKPEYMPVVLAAAEAITDPLFNLHGHSMSTRGTAPLLVINGPIRQEIGINCRGNVFGPGWRANATIGRAIRLLIRNVGGALPGELDRATLGHPGKYTYCIGEDEENSPWLPLHVERGFEKDASVVTVLACDGPHQFGSPRGGVETILGILIDSLRSLTHFGSIGRGVAVTIVFDGEQRTELAKAGYSKADLRRYVYENTWRTVRDFRANGLGFEFPEGPNQAPDDHREKLYRTEGEVFIVAAGIGKRRSAFMPMPRLIPGTSEPISRLVRSPQ